MLLEVTRGERNFSLKYLIIVKWSMLDEMIVLLVLKGLGGEIKQLLLNESVPKMEREGGGRVGWGS